MKPGSKPTMRAKAWPSLAKGEGFTRRERTLWDAGAAISRRAEKKRRESFAAFLEFL